MIVRKQDIYDEFKCIGGICPQSCCEGWQIVIDDEALDSYENQSGAFGSRLYNSIDWEEGVFLQYMGRCAFLNDDNLCDLHCELGEEGLCKTCRQYPRHIEEYYGVREYSLSLSCPEAARMILSRTEPMQIIRFENDEEEIEDDYEDFDFLLYDQLEAVREKLFEIARNRSLSIDTRLDTLLKAGRLLQECLDNNNIFEMEKVFELSPATSLITAKEALADMQVLYDLEFLRHDWKNTLDNMSAYLSSLSNDKKINCPAGYEIPAEQILMSFLYTYFSGAVYDDCIYSKITLAVYSVRWIYTIFLSGNEKTLNEFIRITYCYAREIEHSDLNLNTLEDFIFSS